MTARRFTLAAIAVGLASTPAQARPGRRVQGGAFLHYELSAVTALEDADAAAEPRARELVLAGARLHGFLAHNATVAYHVGLDLAFGGTVRDGGFAYDVALFPVGVVVRLGETSLIGLGAGVGGLGAIGTIDDAVTFPLEAVAELGGGRVRLLARGRIAYVTAADARQDGSPTVPFADEVDAMIGVRLGRHYRDFGFPTGNGYFLGASYRELAGTRYVGVTLGYSIDLAMPRRWGNTARTPRR